MRRWLMAVVILAVCVAQVGADVTIVTTTTIEGPMAAMAGGINPKVVTRIKGSKSRTDIEMGDQSNGMLIDLGTNQTFLLNHAQKTAQLLDPAAGLQAAPKAMPKLDTSVKATGKRREINGQQCDEFAILMKMDMSPMAAADPSQPAAAALKGVLMMMTGSVWVAKDGPGSSEYQSFQSRAAKVTLSSLSGGRSGLMMPGMEQLLSGFAEAPGIPYLTELTMGVEGSGPFAEMMKKMTSQMKVTSQVSSVSVEPLQDGLFELPTDYKVVK